MSSPSSSNNQRFISGQMFVEPGDIAYTFGE
jgi:hypothetical protein